jgi:hypothetical protein
MVNICSLEWTVHLPLWKSKPDEHQHEKDLTVETLWRIQDSELTYVILPSVSFKCKMFIKQQWPLGIITFIDFYIQNKVIKQTYFWRRNMTQLCSQQMKQYAKYTNTFLLQWSKTLLLIRWQLYTTVTVSLVFCYVIIWQNELKMYYNNIDIDIKNLDSVT